VALRDIIPQKVVCAQQHQNISLYARSSTVSPFTLNSSVQKPPPDEHLQLESVVALAPKLLSPKPTQNASEPGLHSDS
jgi:hypothetical protein